MKTVAAFGWPPLFMNNSVKAFVSFDASGNIEYKSPLIDSVAVVGTGVYDITLTKAIPHTFAIVTPYQASFRTVSVVRNSDTVFRVYGFTSGGTQAVTPCSVWICQVPASWEVTP